MPINYDIEYPKLQKRAQEAESRVEELEALRDTSIASARIKKLEQQNTNDRDHYEARIADLEQTLLELADWFRAYPTDIFTPLKGDPFKKTGDYDTEEKRNLITRASASMARHMIGRIPKKIYDAVNGVRE